MSRWKTKRVLLSAAVIFVLLILINMRFEYKDRANIASAKAFATYFHLFDHDQRTLLRGNVVRVIDGDTIVVFSSGQSHTIRLAYIDAPESDQLYGLQSAAFLEKLLENMGGMVAVEVEGHDKYDRMIGTVFRPGIGKDDECSHEGTQVCFFEVNLELLEHGQAWWYEEYDNRLDLVRGSYRDAQLAAKQSKLGLWVGNPVSPWEWRDRNSP